MGKKKCLRDDTTEIQPNDPTPEEIAAACLRIQFEGFTDREGAFQPPWTADTRRARRLHVPGDYRQRKPPEEGVEVSEVSASEILQGLN